MVSEKDLKLLTLNIFIMKQLKSVSAFKNEGMNVLELGKIVGGKFSGSQRIDNVWICK